MVTVTVLINVKTGTAEDVSKEIEKIDNVQQALMVTGAYDVIVQGELPSKADFRRFVHDIHEVAGVLRTETCVSL